MTRVDFYLLEDVSIIAGARFACRLAHKAVQGGAKVYVHANDEAHAAELDTLMWDYPRQQFLAHQLATTSPASGVAAPVLIGWGEEPQGDQVLVNLSDQVPKFIGRFDRVAEIIVGERKDDGRDRYKFYRDCGYPLHHHQMSNWEEA